MQYSYFREGINKLSEFAEQVRKKKNKQESASKYTCYTPMKLCSSISNSKQYCNIWKYIFDIYVYKVCPEIVSIIRTVRNINVTWQPRRVDWNAHE